ncbi:MAG TPA: hypothetical protein VM145_04930 [Sphingomicrobium sp.]|nr:hypothetical protein [Sphingomicrobium sp.]
MAKLFWGPTGPNILNGSDAKALCGAMVRFAAFFALAVGSAAIAAEPSPATLLRPTPAAVGLFERDWVLMNWALKHYDRDGDILIEPAEAEAAATEFRKIADADGDGRVTTAEYRAAREFILARY